uniref:uncharacterized protein isoform X2 n=1 Tax=Myxine glutinosa TaxID=7769 RepID=UPI00358F1BB4
MNSFAGDIYLLLLLAFTFRPTETLDDDQCGCMESSPPPSAHLSVSQPITTTTANVNGRAEFHCDVSMKSSYTDNPIVYITDDPIVYWYKHCSNSFAGKAVFSGKSASVEYINRANQTVHEIQEHSNLRRRRFTLEIFQLNVNDSGDYFCVIKIRARYGPYGDCGGGTRLEVVDVSSMPPPTSSKARSSEWRQPLSSVVSQPMQPLTCVSASCLRKCFLHLFISFIIMLLGCGALLGFIIWMLVKLRRNGRTQKAESETGRFSME